MSFTNLIAAFDNTAPDLRAVPPPKLYARVAKTDANVVVANHEWEIVGVDGVSLDLNDVVLLTAQTLPAQNGLYSCTGVNGFTRVTTEDSANELEAGLVVGIMAGTVNAGKTFRLTTPAPIVLGTTGLTFEEITPVAKTVPTNRSGGFDNTAPTAKTV